MANPTIEMDVKVNPAMLTVESDLIGSIGSFCNREHRIRAFYFKPVMCSGQLLDYKGPMLLIQDVKNGQLQEVKLKDFSIIE